MNTILELETNKHEIKIQNFEGPLDLLCHLIEKNKMSIYDIKIDEITDQYIEYLEELESYNLDIASEFLIMVSTLLYIKSKHMLPKIEEEENEPTEQELIERIIAYKKYKEVSNVFKENYQEGTKRFFRSETNDIDLPKQKLEKLYKMEVLAERYKDILSKYENRNNQYSTNIEKLAMRETITVASKVKEILRELFKKSKFVFNKLFAVNKCSRVELVTAFTGLLELSRRNKVVATQEEIFGDILVEKRKN